MKIKKNSLLLRIVFYNDIAIILTAILITAVLTFITFKDMEARVVGVARDKIILLARGYQGYLNKIRDDLYQCSRSSEDSRSYQIAAEEIKEELNKKNFKNYYDSVITILSEEGKILGEAGNIDVLRTLTEKNSKILIRNIYKKEYEDMGYYLVKINDDIYARIAVPYYQNGKKTYLVISIPVDISLIQSLKNFLELNYRDKVFLLVDDKFDKGELKYYRGEPFLNKKIYDDLRLREYKYYYKNKEIDGKPYYMALYTLNNYNNEYIGSFGIAISKETLIRTKTMVSIFVTILVILVIIIASTITTKIFKKLLYPLTKIADLATKVSDGDYDIEVPVVGSGEIRTLSNSVKAMLDKILMTQKELENQNKKLFENLERIEAIDKLLIGIHIEEDISSTVKDLMGAFTSEIGLGYSRAMFFRYSRERDCLVGEYTYINSIIKDQKADILKEKESCTGFKFQIDELNELVTFMKIPFNRENLLSEALMDRKIVYFNDKGYKHNLGSDLLKSIGLNNFFMFPIYNANRYSGVILVDYYTRNKQISLEEIELLNLLSMNISVRMQNKVLEEDRIENERTLTIEKLAERFLSVRGGFIEELFKIYKHGDTPEEIAVKLRDLKPTLEKIQKENDTLRAYANFKKRTFEEINLDLLIQDVINSLKKRIENSGITISYFSNYTGKIQGDSINLKKAFVELINNAVDALERSKQVNKKININVSKDRRVEKIKIQIIDNGIGMTPEQLKSIHQPFISYSDETPGLGLSFVHQIIKEHVGVIKFFSKYNEGTEVKITLNAYKEDNL